MTKNTSPKHLSPVRKRTRLAAAQAQPTDPEMAQAPAYEVGFGKPPRHSQFKPGQSGNPKGRKKGAKGMRTLAQQTLTAKVSVRTGNGAKKMMCVEALFHKFIELGMKGNQRALQLLFNMYQEAIPEMEGSDVEQATPALTATDEVILKWFTEEVEARMSAQKKGKGRG